MMSTRQGRAFLCFLAVVLVGVIATQAFGQGVSSEAPQFERIHLYGGMSIPLGDFAENEGVDARFAKTGFGFGAECTYPTGSPNLGWIASATCLLNETNISKFEKEFGYDVDIDVGRWINVAVLAGLKCQTQISSTLPGPADIFYGLGQVGLIFVKAPGAVISPSPSGESVAITYGVATTFGFAVGAGFVFERRITVGLRYFGLGEPEIEGTMEYQYMGYEEEKLEIEQKVSILLLTVGVVF